MTLQNIQQIPNKEKKFMIHEICLMYRKLRTVNETTALRDSVEKINAINERTVSMFNTVLALLSSEHQQIIETEFINNKKMKWQDYQWSKTLYYQIKNEAIDQFLYLFFA